MKTLHTLRNFLPAIAVFTLLVMVPMIGLAQEESTGIVPCNGPDCSACNLVDLANSLIVILFGAVGMIFAVLMTIAGFGLVTSAGNQAALSAAKSKFQNAIVGLLIVMAAWLLVDTLMRTLLKGEDGNLGVTFNGWGPWSEVQCQVQVPTIELKDLENEKEPAVPVPPVPPPPVDADGLVSLRSLGVNVAAWHGIDGPGRTDKANVKAANAAKWMQDEGKKRYGRLPFQVTAAYTEGVGHSANSQHYKGTAIDFQPINGITLSMVAALAREAGFTFVLVETKHVHGDMR